MDILNLFKDSQPKFETTLPFSKKKVLFTAFKVKDAKKISLILNEDNKKLSLLALYECIKDNCDLKNVQDLCLADAEYLFLQIRSKSVDELINVIVNQEKTQIGISNIENKNAIQSLNIPVGESITITLATPSLSDLLKQDSFSDEVYSKSCIKSIIISGQVFYLDKFVNEKCKEIIDNLPLFTMKQINEFVKNEPRLWFKVEKENSGSEVSGFLSFFI
jgi:hypothetical protein